MSSTPGLAVLVSIHDRFATAIARGEKTVELRRRFPDVPPGTQLALYVTHPVSALAGIATIESINRASPAELWLRHQGKVGLSKVEFDRYFGTSDAGCAVVLRHYHPLEENLSLSDIIGRVPGFRPPQSFRYVSLEALGVSGISELRGRSASTLPAA